MLRVAHWQGLHEQVVVCIAHIAQRISSAQHHEERHMEFMVDLHEVYCWSTFRNVTGESMYALDPQGKGPAHCPSCNLFFVADTVFCQETLRQRHLPQRHARWRGPASVLSSTQIQLTKIEVQTMNVRV